VLAVEPAARPLQQQLPRRSWDYRRHLPRGFSSMLLSAIRSRGFDALIDRCPNPAASYPYTAALGRKHLTTYGRRESVPSSRQVATHDVGRPIRWREASGAGLSAGGGRSEHAAPRSGNRAERFSTATSVRAIRRVANRRCRACRDDS